MTAWGYLISVAVSPRNSTLLMLVITMILTQVVGRPNIVTDNMNKPRVGPLLGISPTRWSVPMQFVLYGDTAGGQWNGFPPPAPPNCSHLVDDQCPQSNCDEQRKHKMTAYMMDANSNEYHRWAFNLLS